MSRTLAAVATLATLTHASAPIQGTAGTPAQKSPAFERVYALKPEEGVFAYARISPDGHSLAYASQMPEGFRPGSISQTVTVVDLDRKKILFTEAGIDAYWSLDNERIIYSSSKNHDVSIWHARTGAVTRGAAPNGLGDYYSWAVRDGKQLILTIASNFYYLDGDKAVMPKSSVGACPVIGTGQRPLISKDGRQITTFVRGTVVVRNLTDCDNIFDTGLQGAKADFSYDGRYIAFHVAKAGGRGSQIVVVDITKHTIRTLGADLPGSSFFPSWTRDGRLCFRYDGPDYRGFMMASNVLSAPEQPMPATSQHLPEHRGWTDIFPESPRPAHRYNLVMIWGTWSAHSPAALADLQRAQSFFGARRLDVGVLTAPEPSTLRADLDRIRRENGITLAEIPLTPAHFALTEGRNQIPTTLLFRDNMLVDRRLGPQSYDDLREWIGEFVKP